MTMALQGITLGEMKKRMSRKPYDELYHLAMHLTLADGSRITLEKNEVVTATDTVKISKETELMDVPLSTEFLCLATLCANSIDKFGITRFATYSAKDRNCQMFVHDCLEASSLIHPNDEISQFVKQDIKSLFDNAHYLRKLTNTVTDLAGTITKFIPRFHAMYHAMDGAREFVVGSDDGSHPVDQKVQLSQEGVPFFMNGANPIHFSKRVLSQVRRGQSVHAITGQLEGIDYDNRQRPEFVKVIKDKRGGQWALLHNSPDVLDEFKSRIAH